MHGLTGIRVTSGHQMQSGRAGMKVRVLELVTLGHCPVASSSVVCRPRTDAPPGAREPHLVLLKR